MLLTIRASSPPLYAVNIICCDLGLVMLTLIKNDLVSKNDNIKFALALKTGKNIPTRFAASFGIECTNANSPNDLWFFCSPINRMCMGRKDNIRSFSPSRLALLAAVLPLNLRWARLRDRPGRALSAARCDDRPSGSGSLRGIFGVPCVVCGP